MAARFEVSRAWVHRLVQRRRETGSIARRKQTKFRGRVLSERPEERLVAMITARPDATLVELREALPTTAAPSTLWRTIGCLCFTVKKKKPEMKAAIERVGARLRFLPPYSPEFNPVENV